MQTLKARKAHYKIYQKIGEGLTSEVYLASRCDASGFTQQKVALKVLKSRKHVQVLKREFEKLLQVRSLYCVQVYAWESLQTGSALVLEYVPGLCLQDLVGSGRALNQEMASEILAQVRLGLKSLHRQGVVHGDLNLKNILVSEQGMVKLIDFGFYSPGHISYVTPEFAHPQILKGSLPSPDTDFFSLNKVAEAMGLSCFDPQCTPRASRRRRLAKWVKVCQTQNCLSTQILNEKQKQPLVRRKPYQRAPLLAVASLLFCILVLWPSQHYDENKFGYLQVKGHAFWLEYSLNRLPVAYAPLARKKLRVGHYHWQQQTPYGKTASTFDIEQDQIFLLQDKSP